MAVASPDADGSTPAPGEGRVMHPEVGAPRRLERILGPLRILAGVALFGLVILAAVRSWADVRTTLARIAPHELVLSEMLVLSGLAVSVLTWRGALRELGSKIGFLSASKVYLLGQLGKYIPGSVWALVVQMELAKRAGVPRVKGMGASVVAIAVNVVTGFAIGLLIVPSHLQGGAWWTIVLVAVVVVCALGLSPPVLTRLINLGLGLFRQLPMQPKVSWRGVLATTGWSLVSWASYGLALWVLAVAVGAPAGESLPLCLGGTALAMTLGFLVVIAPSGIGVREAVLVAALVPVLERPEALAVALVARLLFTIADLIAAAAVVSVRIQESDVV